MLVFYGVLSLREFRKFRLWGLRQLVGTLRIAEQLLPYSRGLIRALFKFKQIRRIGFPVWVFRRVVARRDTLT